MGDVDENNNVFEDENHEQNHDTSGGSKMSKVKNFFAHKFHTEKSPFHHVNSIVVHQNHYRRRSDNDKFTHVNSMIVHQNNYHPRRKSDPHYSHSRGKHTKKKSIPEEEKKSEEKDKK